MNLAEIIILGAVVYRITRFTQLDSLLEEAIGSLITKRDVADSEILGVDESFQHLLYRKLLVGATCAFCVSVWIAAMIVAYLLAFTDYSWSAWVPIDWLAVSTVGMVFYRYIDPPE